MAFSSISFLIFIICVCCLYFWSPKKLRWIVLLAASYTFYLFAGVKLVFFLLFSTFSTFFGGLWLERMNSGRRAGNRAERADRTDRPDRTERIERADRPDRAERTERADGADRTDRPDRAERTERADGADRAEKKAIKAKIKGRKRWIVLLILILNFGILFVLKYFNDFADGINGILELIPGKLNIQGLNLVLPLGISFYTFQSIGYVIDVYRGKYSAERNPAKYALFVSFFPQLVQGPISRYDQLAEQLFTPHSFDYIRMKQGVQRILWGYFKKMVIADRINIFVTTVFADYLTYNGLYILIAGCLYCIQIYADFSGGMEIASGVAEILGIELPSNFERPYFAKTLPEYWRRWHITLNQWLRDYVFYPISLSKPFVRAGKAMRHVFGNRFGRNFAIYVATFIVRIINAIWHGGDMKYFVSGAYHGLLIILGLQMKPLFDKLAKKLNVRTDCFSFRLFQMLRTFSFVLMGRIMLHAATVQEGFELLGSMFSRFNPWILFDGSLYSLGLSRQAFWAMMFSVIVLLITSILKEKGIRLREALEKQNIIFQWIVMLACIFGIIILGVYGTGYEASQFIYQQF